LTTLYVGTNSLLDLIVFGRAAALSAAGIVNPESRVPEACRRLLRSDRQLPRTDGRRAIFELTGGPAEIYRSLPFYCNWR
jgi:succinate dehydrogenase/fumarate reductase flavoprotein subunit